MSRKIWKALSGVLCVYKPSGTSTEAMKKIIRNRIVDSVAQIESSSSFSLPMISIPVVLPHEKSGAPVVIGIEEIADYRYHVLVSGKSIRAEDVHIQDNFPTCSSNSGISVFFLNTDDELKSIEMTTSWINIYRIDGVIGTPPSSKNQGNFNTEDPSKISRSRFEKVISRLEAEFRSNSFKNSGVDMQSDEAFENARKGIVQSSLPGATTVVSLQTNWFKAPKFSITVHCSGENDKTIRSIVESIGQNIGTGAFAFKVRRQAIGPFTETNALLEKQLSLQNILRNISLNRNILNDLKCSKPISDEREVYDGLGLKSSDEVQEWDAMRPAWPRNY